MNNYLTCEQSREYFPYLKTGLIYFNHAAIGPLSSKVKAALDSYLVQRSETVIENYFETLPQSRSAKERIARLLNVEPKFISWTDNVSNALNVIAQGIKWQHGDQIILNDLEFPSNVYPFMNLKNYGVEILFAKSENGIIDLPQIEKLVTSRTKLVSLSLVQFLTGYRANLKTIGQFCKKNNILFCVDGIQGAGAIELKLDELNVDFFAGGTQKWLMGLQGLSYFYISQELLEKVDQKYVGWTSVKDAWNLINYDMTLLDSAERFQNGTSSRIGMIAADASLSLFEEIGYKNIENQVLDNSEYLMNSLNENGIVPILLNKSRENLSGIVTFKHSDSENIFNTLKENKIICSLREGMIRLSPHFYNTKDDIDRFINTFKDLNIRK
ncbi:MAG: aminotransferase class V-fold PLP-dependent enzyme [Ignavibacteriales bacterium]|nr:aminotransferase class V-fold PLP-dependent enzyme [Ignavibacteriales bacterium]MCB9257991.1 aminotransferase class V-fold PLP-dependent enzyme [Ignavibacteriales bacterium]